MTESKTNTNPYPSIGKAFGLLGILILITIVVSIPIGFLTESFPEYGKPAGIFLGYTIPFGLIVWLAIRNKKYFNYNSLLKRDSPVIYLILLLAIPALGILSEPIVSVIPMSDTWKELLSSLVSTDFLSFITIAIAAPVLEEILFRGIILDGFLKRYSPAKAIIVSSFLFGIVHLNPWQFIAAFIAGLAIGWIYWKTKSLLLCIFMHFVNNALSFYMMTLGFGWDDTTKDLVGSNTVYYIIYAASAAVCILAYMILNKLLSEDKVSLATAKL